jgi:hypothetical protein
MKAAGHVCEEFDYCICSHGLQPNEDCPRHANPIPRCCCGRFVKASRPLDEAAKLLLTKKHGTRPQKKTGVV